MATRIVSKAKQLPILQGIYPYKRAWLSGDVLAGLTLAAVAIPECMGYAKIAGMPIVAGLYTLLLPVFVFAVLGSSRHMVVGADSATAAIMFAGLGTLGITGLEPGSSKWVALAGALALMTGLALLLARILGLGFLADFLSRTVLVGFLTGVGIQVAIGQLPDMFGGVRAPATSTAEKVTEWVTELPHTNLPTLVVALGVLGIMVLLNRYAPKVPGALVALVAAMVVSAIFDPAYYDVAVVGSVWGGFPNLAFPEASWTDGEQLLGIASSIFLVVLTQSAATSRSFAIKYRERLNENVDLLGLGVANLAAGLSSTFVVNGSPTKTAVVDTAGSHSQVAQMVTAAVALLTVMFATGPLAYLPSAALAAIVFWVCIGLVDIRGLRNIYQTRRTEFGTAILTALTVIFVGVEQGIIVAIILSLLDHVRRSYTAANFVLVRDEQGDWRYREPIPGTVSEPRLVVYRLGNELYYANVARFQDEVLGLVNGADPPLKWLVIDAGAVNDVDYSAGQALGDLDTLLQAKGITLALVDLNPNAREQIGRYGSLKGEPQDRYFDTLGKAVRAFRRESPIKEAKNG